MKTSFFTLALLCIVIFASAQTVQQLHELDSLNHVLKSGKQDTTRVYVLCAISSYYTYSYPDTAIKYDEQALRLAGKLGFKSGEIYALNKMGEALGIKGDYVKELAAEFDAFELAKAMGDKEDEYFSLYELGDSYRRAGNSQKALDCYFTVKAHKAGLHFYSWAEEFMDGSISLAFSSLNKRDSFRYYVLECYRLDVKNKVHWSVAADEMADLYVEKGDYRRAINLIYPHSLGGGKGIDKIAACKHLAEIYAKMGRTDSAIYFAKKVIHDEKNTSIISEVLYASTTLKDIYAARHQMDSAYKYQSMMLVANDSLFSREKVLGFENLSFKEARHQQELAAARKEYQAKVRIYILVAAVAVFLLVGIILWRSNRKQQKANKAIQKALAELKATQTQLIQSEKMASLGELTAGIAHEIQNPLNFVNNFSEVNTELIDELKLEIAEGNYEVVNAIADDIKENQQKINLHGKRADAIVKGMLEHSRNSSGQKEPTNINNLADECLRLAYHGLRAKDKSFNAELVTHFDETLPKINVIPQDMVRVMLNLFNNAFYAVNQKQKTTRADYKSEVSVTTYTENSHLIVKVKDNGVGIPDAIKDKIMQPFFTTKPTGEGTGLGLSLTYDMVVKGHGGSIAVDTKEGEFTEFTVTLPLN